VAIEPHPYNEEVIFANCLEGYPIETGAVISSLTINCQEAPPTLVAANNTDDTHVVVEFDRPVTPETAGLVSNYSLFETVQPGNVVPLVDATPQPDSTSVILTTQVALTHQLNYTVRVSGVKNVFGVSIIPGSEITFIASETEPPQLLSAAMTGQAQVELTFSEALDAASAENEPNYEIFRTLDPGLTVTVSLAQLLPTGTVVRLSTLVPFVDGVSYTARVTGVKDSAGNTIGEDNEAAFTAEDIYPPELVSVSVPGADIITLRFTEPLDEASAENVGNYVLFRTYDTENVIPVLTATLDGTLVTLTLQTGMSAWTDYTLALSGQEDLAGNAIVPVSTGILYTDGVRSSKISLYLDEARSDYSLDIGPYQIFDVYVWCSPSSDGMMCAEYAISANPAYESLQCLEIGSEMSPLVSVSMGDFTSGISTCLYDCQHAWTWISKARYMYISGQGTIRVVPHPAVGTAQFATCLEGHPLEQVELGTAIKVNIVWVATMLQNSSADYADGAVTLAWTLKEGSDTPRFDVSRREASPGTGTLEGFENLDGGGIERDGLSFSFTDRSFMPGGSYEYLVSFDDGGTQRTLFVSEPVKTPAMPLTLRQNKPNPFNPATTISLFMPEPGNAVLEIFDVTGRRIATLHSGYLDRGEHPFQWHGTDSAGNRVSSGIYFYRLTAGKESISRKMVLMR
ncbi:MAG TPA: Ig-like domain-containing protein, partial [Candidatus Krumholzibacterium sp.]|nr:Ig-like domain-containing protein [Candidatus Krumholzibacterium sp.]